MAAVSSAVVSGGGGGAQAARVTARAIALLYLQKGWILMETSRPILRGLIVVREPDRTGFSRRPC
jgi:hypothetical protein